MKDRKLKITYRNVNELIPYINNSRKHSDHQISLIAGSIKEFDFTNPILIDDENNVIAGHGRLQAAHLLDIKEVPTIELSHLSDAQQRAYILADNRISLDATWDDELLKLEIQSLKDEDYDLSIIGFDEDELHNIEQVEPLTGLVDDDFIPELYEKIVTKIGDIWILGRHRLMCGDSTLVDDVNGLVKEFKPILMVTDPPYGVNHDPSWRDEYCIGKRGFYDKHANSKGLVINDDKFDWTDSYSLFTGDIAYVWHSALSSMYVAENLKNCGFNIVAQIIWAKQHFSFGRGDYHWQHEPCWYAVRNNKTHNWCGDKKQKTLWEIESLNPIGKRNENAYSNNEKTGHSTQKPIECMARPIINNSKIDDHIYDPFGGSGTTLIACEKLNRKCLTIEINPAYCDIIVKRWQKYTGKDAYLESTNETFNNLEKKNE